MILDTNLQIIALDFNTLVKSHELGRITKSLQ
jgi:hypothetical protein